MTKVVAGQTDLDDIDAGEFLVLMSEESKNAARVHPEAFDQLRHDVDLVTLDILIEQFEAALSGPRVAKEGTWQKFFEHNTFALQQLFAAPVALTQSQAFARLPGLAGSGAQITDFLLANVVTQSIHLVEIKTPNAGLLTTRPYRGSGAAAVYAPHPELAGSVAQLQSQLDSARKNIPHMLMGEMIATGEPPRLDTTVFAGALVVGSLSGMSNVEKQSFLRYRSGLSQVEVVTFDEVGEVENPSGGLSCDLIQSGRYVGSKLVRVKFLEVPHSARETRHRSPAAQGFLPPRAATDISDRTCLHHLV